MVETRTTTPQEGSTGLPPTEAKYKSLALLAEKSKDEWKEMWTDLEFTKSFPSLVTNELSDGNQLSKDQRLKMFGNAFASFMELSWNPQRTQKPYVITKGYRFTKEGTIVTESSNLHNNTNALFNADLASILLLGMSTIEKNEINGKTVQDRKKFYEKFMETYSKLPYQRQDSFTKDHLILLMMKKNSIRIWIHDTLRIDHKNKFNWDIEAPRLLLFLPENRIKKKEDIASQDKKFPQSLKGNLQIYPPVTIKIFINHIRKLAQSMGQITDDMQMDLIDFINRVQETPLEFREEKFVKTNMKILEGFASTSR